MIESRERLVKDALSKHDSRYFVVSLVSKRANQLAKHPDSKGVGWAINQALKEFIGDEIKFDIPTVEKPPKRARSGRAAKS